MPVVFLSRIVNSAEAWFLHEEKEIEINENKQAKGISLFDSLNIELYLIPKSMNKIELVNISKDEIKL
jgi:hypothetical protein